MDIMDIVIYAVYILIFPGALFTCVFGLWLAGVDRKVVARMQKRKGPGILQPTWDFFKLLGKETIVPAAASRGMYLAAPCGPGQPHRHRAVHTHRRPAGLLRGRR